MCPDGFLLGSDWRTCEDVDECEAADACGEAEVCVNTAGGHRCVCGPGWQLGAAGDCQD